MLEGEGDDKWTTTVTNFKTTNTCSTEHTTYLDYYHCVNREEIHNVHYTETQYKARSLRYFESGYISPYEKYASLQTKYIIRKCLGYNANDELLRAEDAHGVSVFRNYYD